MDKCIFQRVTLCINIYGYGSDGILAGRHEIGEDMLNYRMDRPIGEPTCHQGVGPSVQMESESTSYIKLSLILN